jgi:hypothetical protein
MKPIRMAALAAVAGLTLAVDVPSASATPIGQAPIPKRVATADLVVVGTVDGFADKLEAVEAVPGADKKTEYQIAKVKVGDTILGKGAKEIRVGFIPTADAVRNRPPGYMAFELVKGHECLLFLVKHPVGDFYIGQAYYDVVYKVNVFFKSNLDEAKRCAKLLADTKANLESKNADDRFLTAAMLVARYRTQRHFGKDRKQEPIEAAESKAILKALADADWGPKSVALPLTPMNTFDSLDLQAKDGWTPPAKVRDQKEIADAAKKWLKDNADKYRIQRYIHETKKEDTKKDGK